MTGWRWAAMGGACVWIAGCAPGQWEEPDYRAPPATIEVASTDPERPSLLDFDDVEYGSSAEASFTIRSLGEQTLQLREFTFSRPDVFQLAGDVPTLVAPGESVDVVVRYSPAGDEHVDEVLEIESSDDESPTVAMRLLAQGLAPTLRVDPGVFDFGEYTLGCAGELTLTLANDGRIPLRLSEVGLDEFRGDGDMSLIEPPRPGAVIPPGDDLEVVLRYAPTGLERDDAALVIASNAPASPASEYVGVASRRTR